jgi:hypothetical protein
VYFILLPLKAPGNQFGVIGIDGRIILKWILKK